MAYARSFRFVVRDASCAAVARLLPDAPMDAWWPDVVQALSFDALPECPICLGPPAAPLLTRCAHVFCASCICRHWAPPVLPAAATSAGGGGAGAAPVRCPVCYEPGRPGELRCAGEAAAGDGAGGEATLLLMRGGGEGGAVARFASEASGAVVAVPLVPPHVAFACVVVDRGSTVVRPLASAADAAGGLLPAVGDPGAQLTRAVAATAASRAALCDACVREVYAYAFRTWAPI